MKIIKQDVIIQSHVGRDQLELIENAGRCCTSSYKAREVKFSRELNNLSCDVFDNSFTCFLVKEQVHNSITDNFIRLLIKHGHESVLEHAGFTVKIITDRAIANELVRHRLCSYSQQSTRYVSYKDGISFIAPVEASDSDMILLDTLQNAEKSYIYMIKSGVKPEVARDLLPLCTATELYMTANMRNWRHVLKLRTSEKAHPKMRELMTILLKRLKGSDIRVLFEDIGE